LFLLVRLDQPDITVVKGNAPLLIIAPHGVNRYPMDDIHTDQLAEKIAHQTRGWAVINRVYRKPRGDQYPNPDTCCLDLNRTDQAALHPTYLDTLLGILDTASQMLVVWVHGIKDRNLAKEAKLIGDPTFNHCFIHGLIGYGQGPHPLKTSGLSGFTAKQSTICRLGRHLSANGLNVIIGSEILSHYRGRHEGFMNQWFRKQGFPLSRVESLQLELGYKGVRTLPAIDNTARAIAGALQALL
jgi:hypothetical protein